MRKIVILDYHSREVFVIENSPMFYDEGDFELGLALEYIGEEHDIYLREVDVHFMMTNSLAINIL